VNRGDELGKKLARIELRMLELELAPSNCRQVLPIVGDNTNRNIGTVLLAVRWLWKEINEVNFHFVRFLSVA
jgi:hypothetical protein